MSLARLPQLRALRGLLVKPLRLLPPAQASEASRVPDVASDSDSDWDALLDAHGLAPPPTVAAAAVAQPADAAGAGRRARDKRRRRLRKSRQALHVGARSKRPRCVSHATWPALVASLAAVLVLDASTLLRIMWKRWRIWSFLALLVLDVARLVICTFPRIMRTLCRMWAFSGAVGAGRGEDALGSHVLEFENSFFMAAAEVDGLETLRMRRSPTRAITIPESGCARQS